MPKYLSRGIACQGRGPLAGLCPNYAHEEFVVSQDVPSGRGAMFCHHHAIRFREKHGLGPRDFACYECGEERANPWGALVTTRYSKGGDS